MNDDFYRAFEDALRGGSELIKNCLTIRLPFVEPLLLSCPDALAIDPGCSYGGEK